MCIYVISYKSGCVSDQHLINALNLNRTVHWNSFFFNISLFPLNRSKAQLSDLWVLALMWMLICWMNASSLDHSMDYTNLMQMMKQLLPKLPAHLHLLLNQVRKYHFIWRNCIDDTFIILLIISNDAYNYEDNLSSLCYNTILNTLSVRKSGLDATQRRYFCCQKKTYQGCLWETWWP